MSATVSPYYQVSSSQTTLTSHVFTTTVYAGRCYLQTGGQCNTTTSSTNCYTTGVVCMIRVIADVTWQAPYGCAQGTCHYVASTLVSDPNDPLLYVNPSSAPYPPYDVTATAGTGSNAGKATISWMPPSSSAKPVTSYKITVSPGLVTWSGLPSGSPPLTHTFSGLTHGQTYTFEMTATSSNGTSGDSVPVQVTVQ
jgi:hypothetical protein